LGKALKALAPVGAYTNAFRAAFRTFFLSLRDALDLSKRRLKKQERDLLFMRRRREQTYLFGFLIPRKSVRI
jgi:hypothetical protein